MMKIAVLIFLGSMPTALGVHVAQIERLDELKKLGLSYDALIAARNWFNAVDMPHRRASLSDLTAAPRPVSPSHVRAKSDPTSLSTSNQTVKVDGASTSNQTVKVDGANSSASLTRQEVENQLKRFVKVIAVRHGESEWNQDKHELQRLM